MNIKNFHISEKNAIFLAPIIRDKMISKTTILKKEIDIKRVRTDVIT